MTFLFLKHCSISLNHHFLWGSSICITVGLGHIINTQPAWIVCVSPGSFTFHKVEVASEEFICHFHTGEGKVCLQERHWASMWEYNGPTHPTPGRWCYSLLGEWPQMVRATASPAPQWDGWSAHPCLSRHCLSRWTAVFVFPKCMCLILRWPCEREGPGCVAKFSWWGCTCHWANSTYHC